MNNILEISNLTKKYTNFTAVDKLNFQVKEGEIFGLLGPNGAGKSTTIECILGTKKLSAGNISIFNKSIDKHTKSIFNKIGVQFQSSHYPERIKVKEICELTESLYNLKGQWKKYIELFSLDKKHNSFVSELSGGELQKLSVILALIHKPKLIFLDEVTTGLDPSSRRDMWNFLKKMNEEGLTILLTSHYMDEVTKLCNRILILDQGKKIISGKAEDVIKKSHKTNLEDAYLHFIENKNIKEVS